MSDAKKGQHWADDGRAPTIRSKVILTSLPLLPRSWGAKMVTWRDQVTKTPSHFTDIDNERSVVVDKLSGFRQSKFDSPKSKEPRARKTEHCRRERCYATSHCAGDAYPLEFGKQTLFVNAAIQGTEESPRQLPWLVEIELPRAGRILRLVDLLHSWEERDLGRFDRGFVNHGYPQSD